MFFLNHKFDISTSYNFRYKFEEIEKVLEILSKFYSVSGKGDEKIIQVNIVNNDVLVAHSFSEM